jgi:hypothetical protein
MVMEDASLLVRVPATAVPSLSATVTGWPELEVFFEHPQSAAKRKRLRMTPRLALTLPP